MTLHVLLFLLKMYFVLGISFIIFSHIFGAMHESSPEEQVEEYNIWLEIKDDPWYKTAGEICFMYLVLLLFWPWFAYETFLEIQSSNL